MPAFVYGWDNATLIHACHVDMPSVPPKRVSPDTAFLIHEGEADCSNKVINDLNRKPRIPKVTVSRIGNDTEH